MPASGPVYQPTTVGYEQQNEWSQPGRYISQAVTNFLGNSRVLKGLLFALGLILCIVGPSLIVDGAVSVPTTENLSSSDEVELAPEEEAKPTSSTTSSVVLIVIGVILLIVGIAILIISVRALGKPKVCPCFSTKEERLAMQLDNQANGQILTQNPSTDLLVTAQYAPVSEIAYQPPQNQAEETLKLMPADNKESGEESDRMLDSDPRIVLRPLSQHTEEV